MNAIILAGGKGSRLRSVIKHKPKPLAEVCGRPFLEYLLLYLKKWGIKDIIMAVGYKKNYIMDYFGNGKKWDVRISYSIEQKPLGTAGSLKKAIKSLKDKNILVLNGDSFFDLKLRDFMTFHDKHGGIGTISLTPLNRPKRYGSVNIDPLGRIQGFYEKRGGAKTLINAGIYLFNKKISRFIPKGKVSLEKEIFPRLVSKGLFGFFSNGYFVDIGTPESYKHAQESFKTQKALRALYS
jgi:D-glycero-alpha-D-manno-heptose 1-phosphate guanylyltransferase